MSDDLVNWADVPTPTVAHEWKAALDSTRWAWGAVYSYKRWELGVEGLFTPHLGFESLGVPLAPEALGVTSFTQLASRTALVSTPGPSDTDSDDPSAMVMPTLADPWLRAADWSGMLDPRRGWGRNEHAKTFRIAVDTGDLDPALVGRQVRDELPAWWRRVVEWLELLGGDAVRVVDNFHWSDGSVVLYARQHDGLRHVGGQSKIGYSVRPASPWKLHNSWPAALHLAGLGFVPPLACTLISDAIQAHRDGRFRTCLIEAGSACELALREAAGRVGVAVNNKATLGALTKVVRGRIHGLLPNGIYPDLVDVRNQVIHHGRLVDSHRAAVALILAQEVVSTVFPLLEVHDAGLSLPRGN